MSIVLPSNQVGRPLTAAEQLIQLSLCELAQIIASTVEVSPGTAGDLAFTAHPHADVRPQLGHDGWTIAVEVQITWPLAPWDSPVLLPADFRPALTIEDMQALIALRTAIDAAVEASDIAGLAKLDRQLVTQVRPVDGSPVKVALADFVLHVPAAAAP